MAKVYVSRLTDLIEMINQISKLNAQTGNKDLDLPRIAVIGIQSAGKSSVLEGIVGLSFLPRGTGIVTRVPIIIQLYNIKPKNLNIGDVEEYAIFCKDQRSPASEKIFDFEKVIEEIRKRTDERAEPECVSDIPIILEIYSTRVPNLQLIDLPGYTDNALKGQNEDIRQQIKNLVHTYISQPNTLILAVFSAENEIANAVAIRRAKKVDPDMSRTIGVITKMDRAEDEDKIVKILENESLPLALGYFGVINRSQEQILKKTSTEEIRDEEDQFFSKGIYSHLLQRLGVRRLQEFLNRELKRKIEAAIPGLVKVGKKLVRDYESELQNLNHESGEDELKFEIQEKIRTYCKAVAVALEGNNRKANSEKIDAGADIKKRLETGTAEACEAAMSYKPEEIEDALEKILINLDAAFTTVSLNSLAFQMMVKTLTDKFIAPFTALVENISKCLKEHLSKIADEQFPSNSKLKDEVLDLILEKVDEYTSECLKDVLKQIDVQKIFIDSKHPGFETFQRMLKENPPPETEIITARNSGIVMSGVGFLLSYFKSPTISAGAAALAALQQIAASMPLPVGVSNTLTSLDGKKLYFMKLVFSYMLIIHGILNDQCQRLIIYHLIILLVEFVEESELQKTIVKSLKNPEQCKRMLGITAAVETRINDIKSKLALLKETLKIISSYSGQYFEEDF